MEQHKVKNGHVQIYNVFFDYGLAAIEYAYEQTDEYKQEYNDDIKKKSAPPYYACLNVYSVFRRHGKDKVWIGIKRAAELTRLSERTVSRALKILIAVGIFSRQQRYNTTCITTINELRILELVEVYLKYGTKGVEAKAVNINSDLPSNQCLDKESTQPCHTVSPVKDSLVIKTDSLDCHRDKPALSDRQDKNTILNNIKNTNSTGSISVDNKQEVPNPSYYKRTFDEQCAFNSTDLGKAQRVARLFSKLTRRNPSLVINGKVNLCDLQECLALHYKSYPTDQVSEGMVIQELASLTNPILVREMNAALA